MLLERVLDAVQEFSILAVIFSALTIASGGVAALRPSNRQMRNWRLNLAYFAFDLLVLFPLMILVSQWIGSLFTRDTVALPFVFSPYAVFVMIMALMVSDFVGYWRHRLMHFSWLWPVHAAHHSDEDVTWFSLVRFHPLNRLVAVIFDVAVLSLLDFPVWAVIVSNRVRHFYGYLVHSDVNWHYGPFKHLLVSPFLHRWHHATDIEARDKNFATIFSFYDLLFGTFYCPHHVPTSLGVDDRAYPKGFVGQLIYPFKVWHKSLFDQRISKPL